MDRLYPDVAAHTAEEARRFGLVEGHWDVVVVEVEFGGNASTLLRARLAALDLRRLLRCSAT